jgi:CxxC motif-containing protein (DUF1111 family)
MSGTAVYQRPKTAGIATIVLTAMLSVAWSLPVEAKENHQPPVPLSWATADDKARFEEGRQLFELPFTPREGLGPVFNARTCASCHHIPSIGGHGPGYRGNIRFAEGNQTAGRLFHDKSILGGAAEALPDNAKLSKRKPSTLLGLGLVEAIPQEDILAHADPEDRNGDGIRGRAVYKDGHVLRFGSQAQVGSLFEFVADALRQEMGLTSPVPGFQQESGSVELPVFFKSRIPEPNVSAVTVRKIVNFVSLLAPPTRGLPLIDDSQVAKGERLFGQLACVKCHVPAFRTSTKPFMRAGDSSPVSNPAFLNREVATYSDFLLHDLGPTLNDGVALGLSRPGEYRTTPLWGLRFRQNQLLHDGRANNIEQAIVYHAGEASRSRNRFLTLPMEDRRALIEFLMTL